MNEQTGLFDWQDRIEQRMRAVHDEIIAYAGNRQRFDRRSKTPSFVLWHLYELFKEGKSPEEIGSTLRFRYPTDFEQSGPSTLLTLALQHATEEYVNSGHITSYTVTTDLNQKKN